MIIRGLYILMLMTVLHQAMAQDTLKFLEYPATLHPRRNKIVTTTEIALYTGTLVALDQAWYASYPRSSFHFINDNDDWFQIDKAGHALTSYTISRAGYIAKKWTGSSEQSAIWYGGGLGTIYMTTIEILDGFSKEWGASWGDLIANSTGSAIFIIQQKAWNEQRIKYKFSTWKSPYAAYRPAILGSTFLERMIKDYNAQTYWLSINVRDFLGADSRFPAWLNIAPGYGATGMTGGGENVFVNEKGMSIPYFKRSREYYLSVDIDLEKVKVKSKLLRGLLIPFSLIKIPAPALYFSDGKMGFRYLHF